MRIRIVKTPPGHHPQWVREAWVGIVLESDGREKFSDDDHMTRIGTANLGGYAVHGYRALLALKDHHKQAHAWWHEHHAPFVFDLVFHADVCEELPE